MPCAPHFCQPKVLQWVDSCRRALAQALFPSECVLCAGAGGEGIDLCRGCAEDLPRNDSAFRLVVNRTLSELFRTGEIFAIYQKWFDPLGVPTSELLEAAFLIQALPE